MRVDELQRLRVALTRRGNRRLEDDRTTEHMHDRKRMTVAVRVDTDHIAHLICKHPLHLQPWLGDQLRCRSGVENRARHDCDGSRPH